jgi:hypothetical protein
LLLTIPSSQLGCSGCEDDLPSELAPFRQFAGATSGVVMKKFFLMLLVLGGMAVAHMGCEADAKVDDDGGKVKVDVDD